MPATQPGTPFRLTRPSDAGGDTDARLEQQIIESYLARIEQTLEARVDEQVAERLNGVPNGRSSGRGYTIRLAASLVAGIPLTAVAGGVAGGYGHGSAASLAIVAVLAMVFGLNVYYTEAEKDLEKERLRRRP